MRPSLRLLQNSARLTLFTRVNCSLCDTAKATVTKFRERRTFAYSEIDVMAEGQQQWKDIYEYDVPVLHVEPDRKQGPVTTEVKKLMHRFTEEQVEALVDEVEKA